MPSKDQDTRHGIKSRYLSPYLVRILLGVRKQKSAHAVAKELGVDRQSVTMMIRVGERKLGVRLFDRETGRGHSDWWPRETQETKAAWLRVQSAPSEPGERNAE